MHACSCSTQQVTISRGCHQDRESKECVCVFVFAGTSDLLAAVRASLYKAPSHPTYVSLIAFSTIMFRDPMALDVEEEEIVDACDLHPRRSVT